MGEQADAVAELEHEVRPRLKVGVAAANVDHDRSLLARQVEIAQQSAHQGRPGREHAEIVEVAAILGDAAGGRLAQDLARLVERRPRGADGEQHVVLGDDGVRRRRLVVVLAAQRHDLHLRGQRGHQLAQPPAEKLRVPQGDLEKLHAGARGHLDLRLQNDEGEVEEQDGPGHAERVGDRVAHRRIVVAERRDRRLQRRRAGP